MEKNIKFKITEKSNISIIIKVIIKFLLLYIIPNKLKINKNNVKNNQLYTIFNMKEDCI